jgi:hypothetical protein
MPAGGGPRPTTGESLPFTDERLPPEKTGGIPLASYYRPMRATMALIEQKLKIPAWSKVFKPLDEGVIQSQHFTQPWGNELRASMKKVRANEMESVQDYISSRDKWKEVTARRWKMRPEVKKAAQELDKWWKKLLTGPGELTEVGARSFLQDFMPRMRRRPHDVDGVYSDFNLPREISSFADMIRKGEMPMHGMDAMSNAQMALHMIARQKFVEPHWQGARKVIDAEVIGPDGKAHKAIPDTVRKIMQEYVDGVRNVPPMSTKVLDSAVAGFFENLGIPMSRSMRARTVNMLMSSHYAGTMYFRPFLAVRNLTQAGLVIPEVGIEYFGKGFKDHLNPELRNLALKEMGLEHGPAGSTAFETEAFDLMGSTWRNLHKAGMFLYKSADTNNRVLAYLAGRRAILEEGAKLAQGKITRAQFKARTGVIRQYGPVQENVMTHVDRGDLPTAAREWGKQVMTETQYPYRKGNEPLAFKGAWGKMFGMYGIWPVNFLEFVTRNTVGRTGAPASARAGWALRLAATWTATEYMMEHVLGIDASNMTWINPFKFQGGPMVQELGALYDLAGGSDFERRLAWDRLGYMLQARFPLGLMLRDWKDATMEERENPRRFIERLLGARPIDPEDAELALLGAGRIARAQAERVPNLASDYYFNLKNSLGISSTNDYPVRPLIPHSER